MAEVLSDEKLCESGSEVVVVSAIKETSGIEDEKEGCVKETGELAKTTINVSAALAKACPMLEDSAITVGVKGGSVTQALLFRKDLRQFSAVMSMADLSEAGFHPRDSAEDCAALLKEWFEKGEGVGVAVEMVKVSGAEGADDSDALTVTVTQHRGAAKPLEYVFTLKEEPVDADALAVIVKEQRQQIAEFKKLGDLRQVNERLCQSLSEIRETGSVDFACVKQEGRTFYWAMVVTSSIPKVMFTIDGPTIVVNAEGVYLIKVDTEFKKESKDNSVRFDGNYNYRLGLRFEIDSTHYRIQRFYKGANNFSVSFGGHMDYSAHHTMSVTKF